MDEIKIDPQDLKNALDAIWFAAAEIEAKAGKDKIALHYVEQDRAFVKRLIEKYPQLRTLP